MANKWIVIVAVLFTAVGMGAPAKKPAKAAAKAAPVAEATAPAADQMSAPAADQMSAPAATAPAASESVAPAAAATEATVSPPSQGALLGSVELRPSWASAIGEVHTENELTLGYRFNPNDSLVYYQYVNTTLYNPGGFADLDYTMQDGFVRGRLNNLWVSGDNAFHYEGRLYTPTSQRSRDKGLVTALRTYFKFSHKFNNTFNIVAMETPIIPFYSQSGFAGAPNPAFENRVYLIGTISFTDNLYLDLPIWISQTRFRNHAAGAPQNDAWGHSMWIYPELTYQVNPNLAVGAAFYNDASLITADWGGQFGDALRTGVTQLIVRASL